MLKNLIEEVTMPNDLGSRMKENYEDRYRIYLTRRTPVIIRLDGKAFHTLTSKCQRPFDQHFINSMLYASEETAKEMQGFKLAYVQSDEVSFLLTDYDNLDTEAWFDYNLNKIISVSASTMSVYFNDFFFHTSEIDRKTPSYGIFDGRAFNIPKEEVANYFLWRYRDWERNSLLMYCQSFFSHKEMLNKDKEGQHELLHSIGKNWAMDLSNREKNGTFLLGNGNLIDDFVASYETINSFFMEDEK
jgi:tRNA(His) 5'-end guanylyltransferase